MTISDNHFCGECVYFIDEDVYGDGVCDIQTPQRPVACDTPACDQYDNEYYKKYEYE